MNPARQDPAPPPNPIEALRLLAPSLRRGPLAALAGRFHSHVTVQASPEDLPALAAFCKAHRIKLTVIDLADLAGSRAQRDVMTTCYHREPGPGAAARIAGRLADLGAALEAAGFPVVRFKLEHESLPTLERFDAARYREVHVKLSIPAARYDGAMAWLRAIGPGWGFVPSRNPREVQRAAGRMTQFVNLRRYDGSLVECEALVRALVETLSAPPPAAAGLRVIEVKQETAVFDTRLELDRWWT